MGYPGIPGLDGLMGVPGVQGLRGNPGEAGLKGPQKTENFNFRLKMDQHFFYLRFLCLMW